MSFEPHSDDVVLMNATDSLVSNTSTYRINQLKNTLKEQLKRLSASGSTWIEEGVDCQFLEAQAGGGWKKGKIRLRVEIVPNEPESEPEPDTDSSALAPLPESVNPE